MRVQTCNHHPTPIGQDRFRNGSSDATRTASHDCCRHESTRPLKHLLESAHDCDKWAPLLERWEQQARQVFLAAYDEIARAAELYQSLQEVQPLLRLFEVEKALYDVRHELANRPDWVGIPLRALSAFAG